MGATMAPPDLMVTDFRMKGMDGRALVQALRLRKETREVPVIVVATRNDIDEELQGIADQVDEFVAKPFFARDLGSRAKRSLDKHFLSRKQAETTAGGGSSFRGKLSEMNIMDLFQAMEMGAKTCLISFSDGVHEAANVYFGEGQVYNCKMGSVTGDEVVNRVAKWKDGTFEINFSAPRAAETNTKTGTQGLLMEAMRLLDEENK